MYKIELSENYNNNIRSFVFKIKVAVLNINSGISKDNIICYKIYTVNILYSTSDKRYRKVLPILCHAVG